MSGGCGVRCARGGAVERAKPKFEPKRLEFGWTSGKRSYDRGGGMLDAGETQNESLEPVGPDTHEGGRLNTRNRNSSRLGSNSVRPTGNDHIIVVGVCLMRERGRLKA
jgi:hypothetical protein